VPAAIVAAPDAKKGEQLILFTTDAALDRNAVLQKLKAASISELMIPKTVVLLETMPVLGSGKIDYVTLNRLAREKVTA
jgi:acyl-[acyl-carrier-protein]-phospholipid O-acyltransferase/long-chain-fatty-acid--[acyl-carrier-protein] ligase